MSAQQNLKNGRPSVDKDSPPAPALAVDLPSGELFTRPVAQVGPCCGKAMQPRVVRTLGDGKRILECTACGRHFEHTPAMNRMIDNVLTR